MAIGLEDGSASRNAHPWYRRGNLAVADGDASAAESAFSRAHELEADVPMPFEHALVTLDDRRRLSAAEKPPWHNSREPIGSCPRAAAGRRTDNMYGRGRRVHPGVASAVAFHASPAAGTSAGMVSVRVVPGMVRAKSAPNAAAGLTAPDGDRASVSSTARMLAAAVKA